MKTYEEYEVIAVEFRKVLFSTYVEERRIQDEFLESNGSDWSVAYNRKENETTKLDLLSIGNSYRVLYLRSWSEGDFAGCDYSLSKLYEVTKNKQLFS